MCAFYWKFQNFWLIPTIKVLQYSVGIHKERYSFPKYIDNLTIMLLVQSLWHQQYIHFAWYTIDHISYVLDNPDAYLHYWMSYLTKNFQLLWIYVTIIIQKANMYMQLWTPIITQISMYVRNITIATSTTMYIATVYALLNTCTHTDTHHTEVYILAKL